MSTEDREAQEDELLALASIYPEDEFKRAETASGGEIQICLELPPDFRIAVKGDAATNDVMESFEDTVSFLPPIILNFELPSDYPSTAPPVFSLSCKWLSPKQLTQLCQHLDGLWKENPGCVVLFSWMQFLKEDSLEYLNIKSPYEIQVSGTDTQSSIHSTGKTGVCNSLEPPEEGTADQPAIQDVESVYSLVRYILDFNENQQRKCFARKSYMCNICFMEKLGSECTYFKDCQHVYCNICLKGYFEVQINDGQVHALNCPESKCPSVATPAQVKELVGAQLFDRYDHLLLQSSLSLMADVVYCPRPSCQTPVMQEPGGMMGICSSCRYAFCNECKKTYHGLAPCKFTAVFTTDVEEEKPVLNEINNEEDLILLRIEYMASDQARRRFLEKRYGRMVIKQALEDRESKEWLKENCKCCPHCGIHVQKIDGCNKMICTGCKQYFCWSCLSPLSPENPYSHFDGSNLGCSR